MLAGFGPVNIPDSAAFNDGIHSFFEVVGGLSIITFGVALLILGVKALLNHKMDHIN